MAWSILLCPDADPGPVVNRAGSFHGRRMKHRGRSIAFARTGFRGRKSAGQKIEGLLQLFKQGKGTILEQPARHQVIHDPDDHVPGQAGIQVRAHFTVFPTFLENVVQMVVKGADVGIDLGFHETGVGLQKLDKRFSNPGVKPRSSSNSTRYTCAAC